MSAKQLAVFDPNNIKPFDNVTSCIESDYEISSLLGPEAIQTKIRSDLKLIQTHLGQVLSKTIQQLRHLQFSCSSTGSESNALFVQLIQKIKEIETKTHQYESKTGRKSVPVIFLMGGYRSFLLCVLESIGHLSAEMDLILQLFEAPNEKGMKNFLTFKRKRGTIKGSRDDTLVPTNNSGPTSPDSLLQSLQIPVSALEEIEVSSPEKRGHKRSTSTDYRSIGRRHRRSSQVRGVAEGGKSPLINEHSNECSPISNNSGSDSNSSGRAGLQLSFDHVGCEEDDKVSQLKVKSTPPRLIKGLAQSAVSHEDLQQLLDPVGAKKKSSGVIIIVDDSPIHEQKEPELQLTELQQYVKDNYAEEREKTKKLYAREIERLNLMIRQLNDQLEQKLTTLAEEEQVAIANAEKPSADVSLRLTKPTLKRLRKSDAILADLLSKLTITAAIPLKKLFLLSDELYKDSSREDVETIFTAAHLGYEANRSLKEYGLKMKVVYCAVADSVGLKGFGMAQQMAFSWSAAYYTISGQASDRYADLRKKLTVEFVKNVWDLLEDPVTNFFATTLGFAPAMEPMKTKCVIRIPVPASEVLPEESPDDHYLIRCVYISPFQHEVDPEIKEKAGQHIGRTNGMCESHASGSRRSGRFGLGSLRFHGYRKSVTHSTKDEHAPAFDAPRVNTNGFTNNTLILHIHGGGWVSQSPEQHLAYVSEWAKKSQCPVISIDYSLSPQTQYPVAVDECYAVYKWLHDPAHTAKLGIFTDTEPLKIILCGDSAGGNLSAATTIKAIRGMKADKVTLPVGLLLHYPAVNLTDSGSLSRMIFSHDPILNIQTMRCVLDCYLGARAKDAGSDALISPALASKDEHAKFPPTVISVGDVDPLIDDSTYLYHRLNSVNVPVVLRVFRGLPHGFLNLPTQLPKAYDAISDAADYMHWLVQNGKHSKAH